MFTLDFDSNRFLSSILSEKFARKSSNLFSFLIRVCFDISSSLLSLRFSEYNLFSITEDPVSKVLSGACSNFKLFRVDRGFFEIRDLGLIGSTGALAFLDFREAALRDFLEALERTDWVSCLRKGLGLSLRLALGMLKKWVILEDLWLS